MDVRGDRLTGLVSEGAVHHPSYLGHPEEEGQPEEGDSDEEESVPDEVILAELEDLSFSEEQAQMVFAILDYRPPRRRRTWKENRMFKAEAPKDRKPFRKGDSAPDGGHAPRVNWGERAGMSREKLKKISNRRLCGKKGPWAEDCVQSKSGSVAEGGRVSGFCYLGPGLVLLMNRSGDWSWSEDDWSYWSDDWSWGSQDWWSAEQPSASASSGSQSTANVPQDPTKSEPSQNVAAVTVETQDQNEARPSRTVRGAKPGMMTNLFVGACLLIGALSAGVPPVPGRNVPEKDQLSCDDRLVEFHLQAGLVDKSWILFDSGACANCCPEWFAPDYPVLPLNESAPSLRSLSGKTLDVQGQDRKIVQLDCGNGHSLSVQLYVCTGIPFPLVSVARLLLQDFWTV